MRLRIAKKITLPRKIPKKLHDNFRRRWGTYLRASARMEMNFARQERLRARLPEHLRHDIPGRSLGRVLRRLAR